MNFFKLLITTTVSVLFITCRGNNTLASRLFEIKLESNDTKFHQGQTIGVNINNKKEKTITKISYIIDGKELMPTKGKITLDIPKLGNKTITATITYEDGIAKITKSIKLLAADAAVVYTYKIINEYPHDIKAFTQGLEFYNDTLYESTGKRGYSSLRKIDYKTGEIIENINLDKTFFGEGISILNDKIFQLTWRSKVGFIYDLKSFTKIDSFVYGNSKEGWGLCNDGKMLYKSDGSEKIWAINPKTLVEESFIEVYTNKTKIIKINELEYVGNKIYANTWQSNREVGLIINPVSGAVEGVINFSGLKNKVTQHNELNVLNGIAYHPLRKTIFVTGKYWDKLFEIKIEKK